MPAESGQVLVVEDDAEVNDLVCAYARLAGYGSEAAHNGKIALEKARRHHPVLILLDVMLPDLDGFEICRRLKNEPRTCGIPVVLLTALDRDEDRRHGAECGACYYLTKPFDPQHLLEVIRDNADGHSDARGAAMRH